MEGARDQSSPPVLDVVVVLVNGGYASTAIGPIEVFTAAGAMWNEMNGRAPNPRFRAILASIEGAPVRSAYGLNIAPDAGIDEIERADLVFVSTSGAAPQDWMERHSKLLPWLVERRRRGTLLAGVCSGVAFLAEAGLLDGRRATTHWGVAELFGRRYPRVDWRTDLLITEDGGVFCGGGVNAAKDLSLHLVDRLCGRETAVECAKALILDMPRVHQSVYAALPLSPPHRDEKVRAIEEHLAARFREAPSVRDMARRVGMSPRTLIRRFKAATGLLPGAYLQMLRVREARRQLEDGARSVKQVRASVGYRDAAFFRSVFKRHVGLSPGRYQETFRHWRPTDGVPRSS